MEYLTRDQIHHRFEFATEFNDIFDALEHALEQNIDDPDLYKVMFWNKSLSPDEVALFAEQVNKQFPHRAYDNYMWLAEMSSIVFASEDNYDRALQYYRKAARVNSTATEPYVKAVLCYDPDIKIPSAQLLIEFVKSGLSLVSSKKKMYQRLSYLYDQLGNDEMTHYYTHLADEEPE